MIESVVNFFRGTPEERVASRRIRILQTKKQLSKREQETLRVAHLMTRRVFLKRSAASLVGGISIGGLGALIWKEFSDSELGESTYLFYLQSFESVVGNDHEANEILTFFRDRRKRGKLDRVKVLADEPGYSEYNFYTAVADPFRHKTAYNSMQGFADFHYDASPPYLILKRVPLEPTWAGVILAHEAVHIHQRLTGFEQSRQDGFIQGEVDAFDLEFRLLNNQVGGRFSEILRKQARLVPHDAHVIRIGPVELQEISSVFNPPRSNDERNARISAYIVALNFTIADLKFDSLGARRAKAEYLRSVFEGKTPMIG